MILCWFLNADTILYVYCYNGDIVYTLSLLTRYMHYIHKHMTIDMHSAQVLDLLNSYQWKILDSKLEQLDSSKLLQLGYPYRFISTIVQYVLINLIRDLVTKSKHGQSLDRVQYMYIHMTLSLRMNYLKVHCHGFRKTTILRRLS